jgi:predicted acetyltransferase
MEVALRPLALTDGADVHAMLQEIGPGENGFQNDGYGMTLSEFPAFLQRNVDQAAGVGVPPHLVPRTIYWLLAGDVPVGMAKLRHYLNDYLRPNGHVGFTIRPSQRGKGYGTTMLRELVTKARDLGLEEILLTCLEDNLPSRRTIERNGGILGAIEGGRCYYSIRT